MKIRTGFVSNSSSSSFIVLALNEEKLKEPITVNQKCDYPDDILQSKLSFSSWAWIIRTEKELNAFNFSEQDKNEYRPWLGNGQVLVYGSMDSGYIGIGFENFRGGNHRGEWIAQQIFDGDLHNHIDEEGWLRHPYLLFPAYTRVLRVFYDGER